MRNEPSKLTLCDATFGSTDIAIIGTDICIHAARNGHLRILKWLKSQDMSWIYNTFVSRGNVQIMKLDTRMK
jgi:hypothetical protein